MKFSIITGCYNQFELLKKAQPFYDKQTFHDFEWIIADDGSENHEEIAKWASENGAKFVTNIPKEGFKLAQTLNMAVKMAQGEYLVYVFADSYPKEDFLEQLDKVVNDERIVTGLRVQVDAEGLVVGNDWRLDRVFFPVEGQEAVQIFHPHPWELMTSNSMVMPARMTNDVGGWFEGFKGYGREDWDIVMRAFYGGAKLYWAPKALIYHLQHESKPDTPDNIELFNERLQEVKLGSKRR